MPANWGSPPLIEPVQTVRFLCLATRVTDSQGVAVCNVSIHKHLLQEGETSSAADVLGASLAGSIKASSSPEYVSPARASKAWLASVV